MWGDFQFGHMVLKQYDFKHNLFGEAMRKVDPCDHPARYRNHTRNERDPD